MRRLVAVSASLGVHAAVALSLLHFHPSSESGASHPAAQPIEIAVLELQPLSVASSSGPVPDTQPRSLRTRPHRRLGRSPLPTLKPVAARPTPFPPRPAGIELGTPAQAVPDRTAGAQTEGPGKVVGIDSRSAASIVARADGLGEAGLDLAPFIARLRAAARRCVGARRGDATVRFCVGVGGEPTEVSLVRSTGDFALDDEALHCVIPGAAPLPSTDRCLVVPLAFR